ncbi:hypothetical protein [Bradyrhizobium jicamae]|nr:hypothetical protein [Bradyrhizobium jicamae]
MAADVGSPMSVTIRPTRADVRLAGLIAQNTNLPTEKAAGCLTWAPTSIS